MINAKLREFFLKHEFAVQLHKTLLSLVPHDMLQQIFPPGAIDKIRKIVFLLLCSLVWTNLKAGTMLKPRGWGMLMYTQCPPEGKPRLNAVNMEQPELSLEPQVIALMKEHAAKVKQQNLQEVYNMVLYFL